MTVSVGIVRPYFTGWAYENQFYRLDPALFPPRTLNDSDQSHTDDRARILGQFRGSSADSFLYPIDMSYNATNNTWNSTHGGRGSYNVTANANAVMGFLPVLQKYQSTLNYTVAGIDDRDLHNNSTAFTSKDVLLFGHNEYVTQTEYDNLKNWINVSGGTAIFMDGNVMFTKVIYDPTATPEKLQNIDGHSLRYHPATQTLSNRATDFPSQTGAQVYEHWTQYGKEEDGSTPSDAGDKENYWNFNYDVDPGVGLAADPDNPDELETPNLTSAILLYRCPWWMATPHEDDYIINPSSPSIHTIFDYGGIRKAVAANPDRTVLCWYQDKNKGRIIHMGNYVDNYIDANNGANRPIKSFYHWWMKKIAKPYFLPKPVNP